MKLLVAVFAGFLLVGGAAPQVGHDPWPPPGCWPFCLQPDPAASAPRLDSLRF